MAMTLNQTKKMYAEYLLCSGTVMIHLNAPHEEVVVPKQHKWDNQLRLNVDLPVVTVTDDGIRGLLCFDQGDFECFIPWDAIWALTLPYDNHKGMMWEESLPYEVKIAIASANLPAPPKTTLRVIEGGASKESKGSGEVKAPPRTRKKLLD